jgi:hypothetical protein
MSDRPRQTVFPVDGCEHLHPDDRGYHCISVYGEQRISDGQRLARSFTKEFFFRRLHKANTRNPGLILENFKELDQLPTDR